jgi:hypothetical protein
MPLTRVSERGLGTKWRTKTSEEVEASSNGKAHVENGFVDDLELLAFVPSQGRGVGRILATRILAFSVPLQQA